MLKNAVILVISVIGGPGIPFIRQFFTLLVAIPILASPVRSGDLPNIILFLADDRDQESMEALGANAVTMKLVRVPAGKFLMGTDPAVRTRVPDGRETPQREVAISRAFHIGTCEVSRGQFRAFVEAAGFLTQAEREGWAFAWNGQVWDKVEGASWKKPGFAQEDDHPVVCVSYDDAIAFCRWLGSKTGRNVLLPTEAQWEYAARAGTATAFPWGDTWEEGEGWANAADETVRLRHRGWRTFPWADGCLFTSPVGTYRANGFGLHDVIGNVWEWTADWYGKDYYTGGPNVDPPGPATGSQRVARGGSWLSSPPRCRSAGRLPCDLRGSYCDAIMGFRIVVEPDTSRELPACSLANRADWPDFRGPRRDGVSHHVPTLLPKEPKFLWTHRTTGPGHSGVAVADGRVFFADKSADGRNDVWRCLEAATGRPIWSLDYRAEGRMDYTNSPRATPVVHEGLVYLLGAFGHLHCVRAEDGRIVWKKHLIDDFKGELPMWGMTSTPLLINDMLIVNPGAEEASLVALDRTTGEVVWKSAGGPAAYASPITGNVQGQHQVIAYDARSLRGRDVKTGSEVWRIVPEVDGDFNVPTPSLIGDQLLVATGNNSTRLYSFRGRGHLGAIRINEQPRCRFDDLAPDMTTPVCYDGLVFCPHNSYLYCLDAKGLRLLWKQRDMAYYSFATLIAGNGHVLVLSVDGELILIRANREKYEEISRLRIFGDKKTEVWSHPALVEGRLYVRDQDSVSCLLLE